MVLLPRQIYLSPMDFYGTYGHNGGKLHHLKKMSGAATAQEPEILLRARKARIKRIKRVCNF